MRIIPLLLCCSIGLCAYAEGSKEKSIDRNLTAKVLYVYLDNKQVFVQNGLGETLRQYVFGTDSSNLVGEAIFVSDSVVAFIPGHGGYESDVQLFNFRTGQVKQLTKGGGRSNLTRGVLGKYFFFVKDDDLIRVDLENNSQRKAFSLGNIGKLMLDWFAKNPEAVKHFRFEYRNMTSIETGYLRDFYVDTVTDNLYVSWDAHVFKFLPETNSVEYINDDWAHQIVYLGPTAFYFFAFKDGISYFPMSNQKAVKSYFTTHDRWMHKEIVNKFWMLDREHAYISLGEKNDKSLEDILSYNWGNYLHYFNGQERVLVKDVWYNIDVIVQ